MGKIGESKIVKSQVKLPVGIKAALRLDYDLTLQDWYIGITKSFNALLGKPQKYGLWVYGSWSGLADLPRTPWILWDENNFYIAAKVIDDKFMQPFARWEVWQGDNIQIAIDSLHEAITGHWGPDYSEIVLTLTPKGPQIWCRKTAGGKPTGELKAAKLVVKPGKMI